VVLESNLGKWVGNECIGVIVEANVYNTDAVGFEVVGFWGTCHFMLRETNGQCYSVTKNDITKIYGKRDPITNDIPGL